MACSMSVFSKIISDGLKVDRARRNNEVQRLMFEGLPWEEAYRRVNFPHKTKEDFAELLRKFDEAFGPGK